MIMIKNVKIADPDRGMMKFSDNYDAWGRGVAGVGGREF